MKMNNIDNSYHSNNQENRLVTTYQDTTDPKPRNMKRKSRSKKKGQQPQGPSKKQHMVTVHAAMTPATPTLVRPYAINLPR